LCNATTGKYSPIQTTCQIDSTSNICKVARSFVHQLTVKRKGGRRKEEESVAVQGESEDKEDADASPDEEVIYGGPVRCVKGRLQ